MSDCPRCRLSLQPEEYEGHHVLFCGTCWGHWLDQATFKAILEAEVYNFSQAESQPILEKWAQHDSSQVALSPEALCPECGEVMVQGPVDVDRCPVVVDRCEDHGVWLDTSEIKQIQVFMENRG